MYLLTFFNRKFPLVSDLGMEVFLYLSTRFSKDKPGILLKALIFRRKRYDVLLKEEKTPLLSPEIAGDCRNNWQASQWRAESHPKDGTGMGESHSGKFFPQYLQYLWNCVSKVLTFGKTQTSLVFSSLNPTFATSPRRYFRSKKLKQVWFFPHLAVPL